MSDNDSCDAFACVENVVIDGLVVLKIVKHCKEALPAIVSGKLLGLEFDSKVEVTNSFAMPSSSDENEDNSGI
jgi:translation initiation factor 3 subunit H